MDENNEILIERLMAQVEAQAEQIKLLNEQLAYLTQKLFGTSSEKSPNDSQLSLFEDPEVFKTRSQPK